MAGNHKQIKPNTMTQTQTTKQTIEQIINLINEMDDSDLVQLNNEYCQSAHYFDSEIFENDEDFFQTFFENDTLRAIQATQFGDYRYHDNWVRFDGYGNLESFNYMSQEQLCELVQVIAEYICENPSEFTQFDEIDFDSVDDYTATIEQDEKRYSDNKK